jgi:hypothetical protein
MWLAAQYCAVFAVVVGGLGCLANLCDCLCSGTFYYTHLVPATFLCVAFVLQSCTFFIFLETDFWYVCVSCMRCKQTVACLD